MRGGARPNSGRKKKHIKLTDVIKNHCQDFIIEILKDKEVFSRAKREVQQMIDFEESLQIEQDYLYIVKSNNLFKIGFTTNLKSRMNDYKIHFGLVDVIYIYKGFNCFELELYFHNLFSKKRHNGEWYNLNDSDLFRIISHCSKLNML